MPNWSTRIQITCFRVGSRSSDGDGPNLSSKLLLVLLNFNTYLFPEPAIKRISQDFHFSPVSVKMSKDHYNSHVFCIYGGVTSEVVVVVFI